MQLKAKTAGRMQLIIGKVGDKFWHSDTSPPAKHFHASAF
jgi:hypothetical protein